jgi:hypothetical protein
MATKALVDYREPYVSSPQSTPKIVYVNQHQKLYEARDD